MRTQLQSLIFEKFGLGCNDLAEGDAGTDGRESDGLRRKGCRETGGGGKKKKKLRKRGCGSTSTTGGGTRRRSSSSSG